MQRGIVSSTSAMVCDRRALERIERASTVLKGRVGVHLQLTDGRPCSAPRLIPSLVTPEGVFPRVPVPGLRPRADEVRREWRAQMESFLATGLQPAHVDTHHHVHSIPAVFEIFCEIASHYNLRARTVDSGMTTALRWRGITSTDSSHTLGEDNTVGGFRALLETAFDGENGGTVELICHPGYVDAELDAKSAYVAGREEELRLLCSPELVKHARERGIRIANVAGT